MNATKIRDLCKQYHITLKELAAKVGLTGTGIQHILTANSTNTVTIEKIAYQLGVHPGYFFDDSPFKYDQKVVPPIVTETYGNISEMSTTNREIQNEEVRSLRNLVEKQDKMIKLLSDQIDTIKNQLP